MLAEAGALRADGVALHFHEQSRAPKCARALTLYLALHSNSGPSSSSYGRVSLSDRPKEASRAIERYGGQIGRISGTFLGSHATGWKSCGRTAALDGAGRQTEGARLLGLANAGAANEPAARDGGRPTRRGSELEMRPPVDLLRGDALTRPPRLNRYPVAQQMGLIRSSRQIAYRV